MINPPPEPTAAKIDPVPPPTGMARVWKHLKNWQSIYLLLPFSILGIWAMGEIAFILTGRKPEENFDWLIGNSGNVMKLVYLIIFCELYRQQMGVWLTKEEQIANPSLAWSQKFSSAVALCVGAYILSH